MSLFWSHGGTCAIQELGAQGLVVQGPARVAQRPRDGLRPDLQAIRQRDEDLVMRREQWLCRIHRVPDKDLHTRHQVPYGRVVDRVIRQVGKTDATTCKCAGHRKGHAELGIKGARRDSGAQHSDLLAAQADGNVIGCRARQLLAQLQRRIGVLQQELRARMGRGRA